MITNSHRDLFILGCHPQPHQFQRLFFANPTSRFPPQAIHRLRRRPKQCLSLLRQRQRQNARHPQVALGAHLQQPQGNRRVDRSPQPPLRSPQPPFKRGAVAQCLQRRTGHRQLVDQPPPQHRPHGFIHLPQQRRRQHLLPQLHRVLLQLSQNHINIQPFCLLPSAFCLPQHLIQPLQQPRIAIRQPPRPLLPFHRLPRPPQSLFIRIAADLGRHKPRQAITLFLQVGPVQRLQRLLGQHSQARIVKIVAAGDDQPVGVVGLPRGPQQRFQHRRRRGGRYVGAIARFQVAVFKVIQHQQQGLRLAAQRFKHPPQPKAQVFVGVLQHFPQGAVIQRRRELANQRKLIHPPYPDNALGVGQAIAKPRRQGTFAQAPHAVDQHPGLASITISCLG